MPTNRISIPTNDGPHEQMSAIRISRDTPVIRGVVRYAGPSKRPNQTPLHFSRAKRPCGESRLVIESATPAGVNRVRLFTLRYDFEVPGEKRCATPNVYLSPDTAAVISRVL